VRLLRVSLQHFVTAVVLERTSDQSLGTFRKMICLVGYAENLRARGHLEAFIVKQRVIGDPFPGFRGQIATHSEVAIDLLLAD